MTAYCASATIQARIWGAIIVVGFTVSSSVAFCTRTVVAVHLILKKCTCMV